MRNTARTTGRPLGRVTSLLATGALTVGTLAVGSLALTPTAAAMPAPTDPTPVALSAQWMVGNLNSAGLVEIFSEWGGITTSSASYGTSIDLANSLKQVGGRDADAKRITDAVAAALPSYIGSGTELYSGSAAKALALTFDLCETAREIAGYAADVVETLRGHTARATFFASGKWLATHPERAAQLAADPLFELGGHGWVHRNPRLLDAAGREREIALTLAAYARVREGLAARAAARGLAGEMARVPAALRLWRFPYGACNAAALDDLARAGLPAIQWDVVSGDPTPGGTAADMARGVLRRVRPGSIVVFHANGRGHGTAQALEIILPELARRGFALVTVSELLAMGRPRVADTCFGERPGDLDRYDRPGR